MTASNFNKALKILIGVEGGVSDRPLKDDPGGLTNKGITQATYNAYRAGKGLSPQSVVNLTVAEYTAIYREQYWNTVRADDLPSGVDCVVFDYSVNSGPSRAVKDLQRAVGVKVDGIIGVNTLAMVNAADDAKLINDLCDRRMGFLKSLRNWSANKNGWTARVAHVRSVGLEWAQGEPTVLVPAVKLAAVDTAKAPEAAQAQLKTPEGVGLTITAAGAGGEKVRQFAESIQPHMGMDTMLGRLAFAVFTLLMLFGGCLIGYSYAKRIQERGGLGGFVGSVFKGQTT